MGIEKIYPSVSLLKSMVFGGTIATIAVGIISVFRNPVIITQSSSTLFSSLVSGHNSMKMAETK